MKTTRKYALLGVIGGLLVIAFLIILPYVSAILSSLVLAYIFYPIYMLVKKYLKNSTMSAFVVSFLVVLLITLPIIFIVNAMIYEVRNNYNVVQEYIDRDSLGECPSENTLCQSMVLIEEYVAKTPISAQIKTLLGEGGASLLKHLNQLLFRVPELVLQLFITLFILFFLLRDGPGLVKKVQRISPFKLAHTKSITHQLRSTTDAVIFGHILVAAGQAFVGFLGLWIFGISSPIIWGFVMFFFALVPFLGTPVVWVPAVLIKLGTQSYGEALGILIVGLLISTMDNVIRPKIVADKAKIHPVWILLGVLGGISLFGFVGIIIGPVILAVFTTLIEIYEEEQLEA